jgi:Undecaprenyl-phosphate glucose phosphotransferase
MAQHLIAQLAKDKNVQVVGFFDDRTSRVPGEILGVPRRGNVRDLLTFARLQRIDLVIIALPWIAEQRLLGILRIVGILPVDIRLGPERAGYRFSHARYSHLAGAPLLNVLDRPLTDWQMLAKEAEDRVLALVFLLLTAPLMLTVALAIKLTSRGTVLFRQKRYGFNNQLIEVYKFRTMYADQADRNADRLVSRDDPRVTPLGRWLRKTSLDELPQLINVLKGEMSIVGPRPHAVAAKAVNKLYDEVVQEYAARHRVKPGITGWAQVNGWRGETDTFEKIEKRVAYDLHYIENWSLYLDLKIILMTLPALLKSRNAY